MNARKPRVRERRKSPLKAASTKLGEDDPVVALAYAALQHQAVVLALPDARRRRRLGVARVHRMRVATRRARSALRAFRDVLPEELERVLGGELKWLAAVLGEVRDLDVYREQYAEYRKALPKEDAQALAAYEEYLQAEWDRATVGLKEALQSPRYEKLIAQFLQRVGDGPAPDVLSAHQASIADAAHVYVEIAKRRVLKRGRRVGESTPSSQLHELRKDGKKLRYLLEFFEPFFPGFAAARKAAVGLQDVLGEHQDAVAATERLRAYAATVPLEETFREELLSLGQLIEVQRHAAIRARQRFDKRWRAFETAVSSPAAAAHSRSSSAILK